MDDKPVSTWGVAWAAFVICFGAVICLPGGLVVWLWLSKAIGVDDGSPDGAGMMTMLSLIWMPVWWCALALVTVVSVTIADWLKCCLAAKA
jgi:hypothetical protein